MKQKENFVIYCLGGGGKYHMIFRPRGLVGIAFGSVKTSIKTIQEIIDIWI